MNRGGKLIISLKISGSEPSAQFRGHLAQDPLVHIIPVEAISDIKALIIITAQYATSLDEGPKT